MTKIRIFLSVFLTAFIALASAAPLYAAELVYPSGSRVGIVPLDGLTPVNGTFGFESKEPGFKMLLAELPAAAFVSVDTGMKGNAPMPPNVTKPESISTAAGPAYLSMETAKDGAAKVQRYAVVVGGGSFSGYAVIEVTEQAAKTYPDDAIRKMLASITTRAEVPLEEQLAQLPFKISELSGFKTVRTLGPGGVVLISDGSDDGGLAGAPYMVISVAPAAPGPNDDRGALAQQLAASIPGLKDARVTNSEPVRIGGTAGYETRIEATAAKEDKPITVVQWLRFGGGSTLRIVAGSTREDWPQAFPRFRAVRDGIGPK